MIGTVGGQTQFQTDVLNSFHQDSFNAHFSNFPTIAETQNAFGKNMPVDMRVFDYFVKNVTIPDQSLETMEIPLLNRVQLQPSSRGNDNLHLVTVEFIADNAFLNYFLIYTYIRQMRTATIEKLESAYYKNRIYDLSVEMNANKGNPVTRLKFVNLFPMSLGALTLESGNSGELTFPASFSYEDFVVEIVGADEVNG